MPMLYTGRLVASRGETFNRNDSYFLRVSSTHVVMAKEVFSFAQRPNGGATNRMKLLHLDCTIFEACANDPLGGVEAYVGIAPPHCTEALYGVVRYGGDAMWIECDVYDDSTRSQSK